MGHIVQAMSRPKTPRLNKLQYALVDHDMTSRGPIIRSQIPSLPKYISRVSMPIQYLSPLGRFTHRLDTTPPPSPSSPLLHPYSSTPSPFLHLLHAYSSKSTLIFQIYRFPFTSTPSRSKRFPYLPSTPRGPITKRRIRSSLYRYPICPMLNQSLCKSEKKKKASLTYRHGFRAITVARAPGIGGQGSSRKKGRSWHTIFLGFTSNSLSCSSILDSSKRDPFSHHPHLCLFACSSFPPLAPLPRDCLRHPC